MITIFTAARRKLAQRGQRTNQCVYTWKVVVPVCKPISLATNALFILPTKKMRKPE